MMICTCANMFHRERKWKTTTFWFIFLNWFIDWFIILFLFIFLEKLIKIYRVGRINRVGRVTPIKLFFMPYQIKTRYIFSMAPWKEGRTSEIDTHSIFFSYTIAEGDNWHAAVEVFRQLQLSTESFWTRVIQFCMDKKHPCKHNCI